VFQYSMKVRNDRLAQIMRSIGPSPELRIFEGEEPENCAAADPDGLLATLPLPARWLAEPDAGSVHKAGEWTGKGSADGIARSFRIYGKDGCSIQGDIGAPREDADMILDNLSIAEGQTITVLAFTITAGNG
jgi:hypothetical protein